MSPPQVEQTARHLNPAWAVEAMSAITALARDGETFTAYDVVERFPELGEPAHPNHWGATFYAASQADVIYPVGATTSRRRSCRSLVRIWRGTDAVRFTTTDQLLNAA